MSRRSRSRPPSHNPYKSQRAVPPSARESSLLRDQIFFDDVRKILDQHALRSVTLPSVQSPLEDRRKFHPLGDARPPLTKSGRVASVKQNNKRQFKMEFADPRQVIECAKRNMRKEVMHALKLTNKGRGSRKRRGPLSHISC